MLNDGRTWPCPAEEFQIQTQQPMTDLRECLVASIRQYAAGPYAPIRCQIGVSAYFPAISRAAVRSGSLENTMTSPPVTIHLCRTVPSLSIKKKARSAIPCLTSMGLRDSPPYCRVTCRSGKSLSSG